MNGFDRIHDLHRILKNRKTAISLQDLLTELECSKATFHRIRRHMTDYLGAPIQFNRELGGYIYQNDSNDILGGESYELPGVWFNEEELHALLLIQSLAANFGVLKDVLAPIEERFNELLSQSCISQQQIKNKVRFLGVATRKVESTVFVSIVNAALKQERIHILYKKRDSGVITQREISPQRIINYRNNWYLDAWCHLREGLRTFSLECVQDIKATEKPHKSIGEETLDTYFQASYGVYAGGKIGTATIRFAKEIAHRIADEEWHPKQKRRALRNGEYEIEIPYNEDSPEELVRDIIALGPRARVLKPQKLINKIKQEIELTLSAYQ